MPTENPAASKKVPIRAVEPLNIEVNGLHGVTKSVNSPCGIGLAKAEQMPYRQQHQKNGSDSIHHGCFHSCLQRSHTATSATIALSRRNKLYHYCYGRSFTWLRGWRRKIYVEKGAPDGHIHIERKEKVSAVKLHASQYIITAVLLVLAIGLWRLQVLGAQTFIRCWRSKTAFAGFRYWRRAERFSTVKAASLSTTILRSVATCCASQQKNPEGRPADDRRGAAYPGGADTGDAEAICECSAVPVAAAEAGHYAG